MLLLLFFFLSFSPIVILFGLTLTRYAFTAAIARRCSLKMLNAYIIIIICKTITPRTHVPSCMSQLVANVHVINLLISPKSETISAAQT